MPVTPEPLALDALDGVLASIERVRARMHARAPLLGMAIAAVDPRRGHHREAVERLRAEYREQVFHTEIRWSAVVAAGSDAGRPPAPTDAFRRLGGEVLHRLAAARTERAS